MSTRYDGHRDGRPDEDSNVIMAELLERDASEQERIDTELDRRYRDSPMYSAAHAWATAPAYGPESYLAQQQAAIQARLANHLEVFADAVCAPAHPSPPSPSLLAASRPAPDSEPPRLTPSSQPGPVTTAGESPPRSLAGVVAPLKRGVRPVGPGRTPTHTDGLESK